MDWNYIAGFFDGEATISKSGKRRRIGITQTNKQVLEEIKRFTKVGNVLVLKKRKSHWKDAWLYYVSSQKDVLFFLNKISNKLIVKRITVLDTIFFLRNRVRYLETKKRKILERKKLAKNLRGKGLSYRQIGKKLNIDWGYTRRIILDLK